MRCCAEPPIMLAMTRPNPAAKVLLVQDRRTASESRRDTPIRRYRLARVRFDSRPPNSASRFDYLKRVYD
jgi:hypothetical protein